MSFVAHFVYTVHTVHPQATLYTQNIKEIPTESEWLCWVVDFSGSSYSCSLLYDLSTAFLKETTDIQTKLFELFSLKLCELLCMAQRISVWC